MSRRIWIACLAVPALCLAPFVSAQELPAKTATALQFIPADSGLFLSFLRWGELAKEVVESEAYQALVEDHEFPQTFVEALDFIAGKTLDEEQAEQWKTFWAEEENTALLGVIEDLFSKEVLYHADNRFAGLLQQYYQLSADMNRYQAEMIGRLAAGNFDARPDDLGKIYVKHLKTVKLPGQTLAFRISDAKAVNGQLARLEKLLQAAIAMHADWANAMSRKKINGAEFITFALHGGMIPKEALEDSMLSPEMQAEILATIKDRKVAAAIGVWNNYLVVHVGETLAGLEQLGKGPLLADLPEFARLRAAGNKPFTSIQFASAELMRSATNDGTALESSLRMIPAILRSTGGDPEAIKEVEADIVKLSKEMETPPDRFGANAFFSYRIPGGYETFDLNWTKFPGIDGSKPLPILDHVGGSPLFFFAGRNKVTGAWYDRTSFWTVRIAQHIERFSLALLPEDEDQRKEYAKIRVEVEQILRRFDEITRTNLLPAMKDGQYAVVLDAKLTDKEWVKGVESEEPVAAPEAAVAIGINQVGLFRQAGEDYLQLAQESVKRLSELAQSPIPAGFEIPAPQKREFPEGTVYYYQPGEFLSTKFAPNVGLSDNFAVFSLFPQQTKRMLGTTKLTTPDLLADAKKPRAAAVQIQFAAFVDAVEAWIEYGQQVSAGAESEDADDIEEEEESFLDQARPYLQLLRGLKSITAETTMEEGVLVTHGVWRLSE